MIWATLIPIIAKYGVEFAYKLWANVSSKQEVTQEQWDELLKLADKTFDDYLAEAKKNNPAG